MLILPNGIKMEMQWKQVTYIRDNDYVVFEIIPMLTEKDIVMFPNLPSWLNNQKVFSSDERQEIIFLLERTAWKRDIKIVEMDIHPYVNRKIAIVQGMIESTEGYKRLAKENLFDVNSALSKDQVKAVYCKLEEKFAKAAQGTVKIPKAVLLEGSIIKEISVPALEKNEQVQLSII